jgi:hypothetical protein
MTYWNDEHKMARKALCELRVPHEQATALLKVLPPDSSQKLVEQVLELRTPAKLARSDPPPQQLTSGPGKELIKAAGAELCFRQKMVGMAGRRGRNLRRVRLCFPSQDRDRKGSVRN